ncbi:MAG: DUF2946 family protein [Rhizomicrobium sp.]|jgi:hypothetical protein
MLRTLKLAGVHVALVAMFLRALLPTGWMPNPSASATVPLVICTMNGPVHVTLDTDGPLKKDKPGHEDGRQHDICPFAAAIHLAVPTSNAVLAPSSSIAGTAVNPVAPYAVSDNTRYSAQSPRAPPSFV